MSAEFLYGINTAQQLLSLSKRRVLKMLVSKNANKNCRIKKLIDLASAIGVCPEFCEPGQLDKLARGRRHQGIIIMAEPLPKITLSAALNALGPHTVWAALDGIMDPMNLGAIIRSAACLGVSSVLLPQRRNASLTPAAQKAAAGAAEKINIIEIVNLNQTILKLKSMRFWIYGMDMSGKAIDKIKLSFPMLLIIGSEGRGIHKKTMEHCDEILSIPQKGGVQSLNASIASAIAFYEVSKYL